MDTSASGNAYFVGRIGAAKVAMFLDKWAEGDTPVWELFVQDGDRPARRLRMPGRWPTAPPGTDEAQQRTHARPGGCGDVDGTRPSPASRPTRRRNVLRETADWQAPLGGNPLNDPLPPDMQ
jgi:hypothetical protein